MGRRTSDCLCVLIPHRNRPYPSSFFRSPLSASFLMVVESVEGSEEPDPHKHPYVRTSGIIDWEDVEMARAGVWSWVVGGYRVVAAAESQRPF